MDQMLDSDEHACTFRAWMNLQEMELSELVEALNLASNEGQETDNEQLRQLILKGIEHFEEYMRKRVTLARENVSIYFAPNWCTPLECSMMWIAGCRPTIFIRLLYALMGNEFESNLEEFLQGRRTGNLGDVSPRQMNLINSLHSKTVKEEDKLSARMASLQEDMADNPISIIAKESRGIHCKPAKEIEEALDKHAMSMLKMLEEADKLRLSTLKELINILSPLQAVNFLAAGKKLHLCLHEWSGPRNSTSHGN